MCRPLLSAALLGSSLLSISAQADTPSENDLPDVHFSAEFFVDGVAYEATQDLKVQDSLGIYNVHGSHEHEGEDGHSHGGGFDTGLNLNNAEAAFGVLAPGWLDGRMNLSMTSDGLELEEAWLRTQFLPGGLQLKAGKMLSDIGSLNNKHPHAWDFVDQALPYQMLLGGSLSGTGLQAVWKAPTSLDLRLGVEALTGDNDGIAAYVGDTASATSGRAIHYADKDNWPNVWTAFAKIGGEIAPDHHLKGGVSWVKSDLHQELHTYHPGINDAEHGLQGEASMWGLDAAYHYESGAEHGLGDIQLLGEYWMQNKDMSLVYHELKPALIGQPRDLSVDAFTLQALYGVFPRWQIGLRYDRAGTTHEASRAAASVGPTNTSAFDPLDRISGVLTWKINANNQLRFQLSNVSGTFAETLASGGKDQAVQRNYNEFFLQYQFNFGTLAQQHQH
ncbi:MAG: hypothetical protein B7Y40_02420 [Gammaproteobacteria bacterium 28-57-27]|nr:MAG: hypothetical protein B7Y40_02420 [Gammaproteobacteria bacterium 28-57-27]